MVFGVKDYLELRLLGMRDRNDHRPLSIPQHEEATKIESCAL